MKEEFKFDPEKDEYTYLDEPPEGVSDKVRQFLLKDGIKYKGKVLMLLTKSEDPHQ